MPDDPAWAFGAATFSIELWARFNQVDGRRTLLSSDTGAGAVNKWVFWLDNGELVFHLNGASGAQNIGRIPITPRLGLWYHLVVTRSGSTYSFYRNGQLAATQCHRRAGCLPTPDAGTGRGIPRWRLGRSADL